MSARRFVEHAEAQLAQANEEARRAAWIRNTHITGDSIAIDARAAARYSALSVALATQAARIDPHGADIDTRRKLALLRLNVALPPPPDLGAAEEMTAIAARLDSKYATARFAFRGREIGLSEAERLIAASRDPAETRALYEGWRSVTPPMKADYARLIALANQGARNLGFADLGTLWRSVWDMPPDDFAAETDRLWSQLRPLYAKLHCVARKRLNARYGAAIQPVDGTIRADLLGNMWSQRWDAILDIMLPGAVPETDRLTAALVAQRYDAPRMVRAGEGFFTSLGFAPLPASFWTRSILTRPRDREMVCHASAWDIDNRGDVRIKMCADVDARSFRTIHHELGHNFHQLAYRHQPFLFRNAANDGFHEGLGDFIGLSVATSAYRASLGLEGETDGAAGDLPLLLATALDTLPSLAFALAVDRWRWAVMSGSIAPARYNREWVDLMRRYQGVHPPAERPADGFDAAAKYHVPANVPMQSYFMARIFQYQFHRASCRMTGNRGPLHRCSIFGNRVVGDRLRTMLAMGRSHPWPDALERFAGERRADATAMLDYFAPLTVWLDRETAGQKCGW